MGSRSLACLRPRSQGSKKTKANIKNADNLVNERKPLLEDYSNVFCNSFFFNTCETLHFFFCIITQVIIEIRAL